MMSGVVDPETLYTKQNCIGIPRITLSPQNSADSRQVVAVLGKFTKGMYFSENTSVVCELY